VSRRASRGCDRSLAITTLQSKKISHFERKEIASKNLQKKDLHVQ
jgi:hypothetical protein